jgi:hypothetical protein
MTYAPVKSDPWDEPGRPRTTPRWLWPESTWRRMVRSALLLIEPPERRCRIAALCSFRFSPASIELEAGR